MNHFYVYQWLRTDSTPYYIGKGQTNRAFDKRRRYIPPTRSRIQIIEDNLTEQQAFNLEIKLIAKYGRKEFGGILRNKTEGGEGATHSPESIKKMSLVKKGKPGHPAWNKGKKLNYNNGLTGHTAEAIAKIKAARAKQVMTKRSKETKEKMRQAALKRGKRLYMIGNKFALGIKKVA